MPYTGKISDEQRIYADAYLKKVILNTKRKFFRRLLRPEKYGITFVRLDPYAEEQAFEEFGYEKALCQYIDILGSRVPVYSTRLYSALMSLSERQRITLIGNVVLGIPMERIAQILGVHIRTAEKYKHNAILIIRKEMEGRL